MDICKFLALVVTLMALFSGETKAQQVPGANSQVMACMQRLLPCQPYIHKVDPPPPPSCCVPMKEIVEKDAPCLCTVFNNPEMLDTLNLTKENALDLPKACGAKPDVSLCNNKTASSSPTPSPGSTNGGSSLQAISFNGLSFLSALVAMIFL